MALFDEDSTAPSLMGSCLSCDAVASRQEAAFTLATLVVTASATSAPASAAASASADIAASGSES